MHDKKNNYTSGYDDLDAGQEPEVTFAAAFGSGDMPGVLTKPERGYRYTATGLLVERELSEEDWRGMLPELEAMQSAYQLIIGDCTLYGLEHGYIESYQAMADLTGYTAGSLEVYASLCRSIPRLMRINSLTYSHYQQIAPLPEEERPHWISYAASNALSYRTLKALITETQTTETSLGDIELPDGVTMERVDLPAMDEDEMIPRPAPVLNDREKDELSFFFKAIRRNRVETITPDKIILIRKALESAARLLNYYARQHE